MTATDAAGSRPRTTAPDTSGPTASSQPAHDLLLDFGELHRRFQELAGTEPPDRLTEEQLVDAFLLAAGMHQVVEDYIHSGGDLINRATKQLARMKHPLAGIAAATGSHVSAARYAQRAARLRRRLRPLRLTLEESGLLLARDLLANDHNPGAAVGQASTQLLSSVAGRLRMPIEPNLGRQLAKLPACFRSLDQQPADCRLLARGLVDAGVPPTTPLLVMGLRTSGSYLAPLLHAALEQAGFSNVDSFTARPRQPWSPDQVERLKRVQDGGGLCLVIDDPPKTGGALVDVTSRLEDLGLSNESIVLMLPVIDPRPLRRPELAAYRAHLLDCRDWSIETRLAPDRIRDVLRALLEGREVTLFEPGAAPRAVEVAVVDTVSRLQLPELASTAETARHHLAALYRVGVRTVEGEAVEHSVYVKGTGLGYMGRHSFDVAVAMQGLLPPVYGVSGGLMYRAWLPEEWRLRVPAEGLAESIAEYAATRRRRLAVSEDVSLRLAGGGPLWKLAGNQLARAFGRAAPAARMISHEVARRLTATDRPAVWDGSMALENWFAIAGPDGGYLKVDFDERAFANQDSVGDEMYCYDVDADVAAAAAAALPSATDRTERSTFGRRLREAYEMAIGSPVGDEKWLLYQLVYLQHQRGLAAERLETAGREGDRDTGRLWQDILRLEAAMAQVHQRYYAAVVFADATPAMNGGLCAIDVDGVLETLQLSFPAITPAGALALRRLHKHGFRTLLASGRSLPDVVNRCDAYGTAGGVAEYGAVTYDAGTGVTEHLISDPQAAQLDAMRSVLARLIDVELDPAFTGVIRAYAPGRDAARRALAPEVVGAALAMLPNGPQMTVVQGGRQTDFIPAGIDKGIGVRALAQRLGAGGAKLAMACGDTAADIPMIAEAEAAYAPANVDGEMRQAGGFKQMEGACQSGLLEAVNDFLRHGPHDCQACRPAPRPPGAQLLLGVLGAQDGGAAGKARQALSVAWLLGRRRLP